MLDELRRRGHEVLLRTLADEVGAMRSRGFAAATIAPNVEELAMEDWRARTVIGRQARATRIVRARAPHDSRDLLKAIEEEQPEALIVDVLATGALSVAAAGTRPWSCYRPFPLPRSRVGLRALGVAGPLSRAPLHLYMSAGPFEPARRAGLAGLVMVGPCAWDPPGEVPATLAAVEGPLVLVTGSTEFQNDGRLVQTALEALADEPLHVVATVPAAAPEDFQAPANATVVGFAPHAPILARAACAITHGGMGATQKALAMGVPVCAVPFGRDQFQVARRVKTAAAGTRLPVRRLSPDRLRAKVQAAIDCKPGAERVARSFTATGGPSAAANAIERRLLTS